VDQDRSRRRLRTTRRTPNPVRFRSSLRHPALEPTQGPGHSYHGRRCCPLLYWLQKKRELDVENQRAQDEALQAYLNQIGVLILHENLGQSEEVAKVSKARTSARARTLTVLSRLDGGLKASIVQFLYESDLIKKDRVVLNLNKADLKGADFRYADLDDDAPSGAYLRDTIMPNGEIAAKSPTIEIKGRPDGGMGRTAALLNVH
jgi:hypothetical protein